MIVTTGYPAKTTIQRFIQVIFPNDWQSFSVEYGYSPEQKIGGWIARHKASGQSWFLGRNMIRSLEFLSFHRSGFIRTVGTAHANR